MEQYHIKALPKKSTLQLGSPHRALGRMTDIPLFSQPPGDAWSDLAGDILFEQYMHDPQAKDEIPEDRAVNRALLDWMRASHGWNEAKATATANLPSSIAATRFLYEKLSQDGVLKEALEKQQEASDKQQEAEKAERDAQNLENAARGSNNQNLKQMAQQARAQATESRKVATDATRAAGKSVGQALEKPLTQAAMLSYAQEAAGEAREMAEVMAGWGHEAATGARTDPHLALEIIRQTQGKIRQISRLAGRMRGYALKGQSERVPQGVELEDVGYTRDLRRTFPSELALLRDDAPAVIKAQKTAEYATRGLIGFEPSGDEDKRGDFVAATDKSGSMSGGPDVVAKAIALGCGQTARMEGRTYTLFTFATRGDGIDIVRSDESFQKHLDWAGGFGGGGTDFELALDRAIEHLRQLPNKGKKADLLFISDGGANVNSPARRKWAEFKAETGSRLFYVPVGNWGMRDIEDIADRVLHIEELDEETGAGLAYEVGKWM
jgi:uncharacterized protein with von Willebrand factor type A (vWA) domain